jgi:hypothetical protein
MNFIEQTDFEWKSIDEIIYILLSNFENSSFLLKQLSLEKINIVNIRCAEIIASRTPEIWKLIPIENLCETVRIFPIQVRNSIPEDIWNYGLLCETVKFMKKKQLENIIETEEIFSDTSEYISEK